MEIRIHDLPAFKFLFVGMESFLVQKHAMITQMMELGARLDVKEFQMDGSALSFQTVLQSVQQSVGMAG